MPDQKRKRVHNQRNLCDYILSLVDKSSVPLRIGASPIPNAGSGLFVVADVAAGADIFRSQPLLLVSEGNNLDVCDYCFLNKNSLISPENKFFVGPERDKIEMSACMGCKIARYCSKACQKKAWKAHHKYECPVVKDVHQHNKNMGALPQTLLRLVLWIDKAVISENNMRVVANLETHSEDRTEQWEELYSDEDESPLEDTFLLAHNIKAAARSNMDWSLARQLCCMLMTNVFDIHHADTEHSYGSFLDLVLSMINHSCDANAHFFIEGRELRCRALKDIPAGTEITVHYYSNPPQDVLIRRTTFKNHLFITCSCKRCKYEVAEHIAAAVNRQGHLAKLKKAQLDLMKLQRDAEEAFHSSRVVKTCISFQEQIVNFLENGYPNGNWPPHIEPLPTIYRTLGNMYRDLHFVLGLEFLLKGNLYQQERRRPSWVFQLQEMAKFLTFLANAGDDEVKWAAATRNKNHVNRNNMRDVARGYLSLACVASKFALGLDSSYARALHDLAGHTIDYPGDPEIHTEEFREQFKTSQDIMLLWANMKPGLGLRLPSHERIVEMRRDIEVVWSGKVPLVKWPICVKATKQVGCEEKRDGEGLKEEAEVKAAVDEAIGAMEKIKLGGADEKWI